MTDFLDCETPDNPVPPDATRRLLSTPTTARSSVTPFSAAAGRIPKGTVVLLPGRNECIEKYFETVGDLTRRGFAVAMFDWRGQGGSQTAAQKSRNAAMSTASTAMCDDLDGFLESRAARLPRPYYLLAHSTGGAGGAARGARAGQPGAPHGAGRAAFST